MEQRVQEEDAAGEAAFYNDYANGKFNSDPEYDRKMDEFEQTTDKVNQITADMADEDGNNYPAIREDPSIIWSISDGLSKS